MSEPNAITAAIMSFIQGRFPKAEFGPSDDIFSLGYVNSLFAMELVMYLEKDFGITISNDELRIDNFRTAEAMTALVGRTRLAVPV